MSATGVPSAEEALRALADAYDADGPAGPDGTPVVALVGAAVPIEPIVAAGALPFRIRARQGAPTRLVDGYGFDELDPPARSELEQVLGAEPGRYDALVVANDRDSHVRCFHLLRELQRVEPVAGLPPLFLVDLLHLPHRSTALYDRGQLKRLCSWLAELTGRRVDDDALREATAAANAQRLLLQRAARELRDEPAPRIAGAAFLRLVGAGQRLPAPGHARLVEAVLAGAASLPAVRGPRVLVTGSPHDDPDAYELIEAAGAAIVGDDHGWGDAWYDGLAAETARPLDGIVDRHHLGPPLATRCSSADRAAYVASRAIAARAEAVVAFRYEHDQATPWDLPAIASAVEAAGLPLLAPPPQPYGRIDAGAVADALGPLLAGGRAGAP